ncbi:hypothetical protein G7Y89_g14386 [Cudoniella acicularis]|uniref:Peptidase A1 domain-containing protein n=1 Tax=Cudoniella acicularis TaxID=354080 RepID=A0A8H4VVL7_9HELO|nr:hypothetical protein G7Y89_g14386 [Cudoniella acicularis]
MYAAPILVCIGSAISIHGATFRAPIEQQQQLVTLQAQEHIACRGYRCEQHRHAHVGVTQTAPLWDSWEQTYVTRLSIGTPPQFFNMLLSISSSDLVVLSSHCIRTGDHNCGNVSTYNSSLSSSYISHEDRFWGQYNRGFSANKLSEDLLHFAAIDLPHQKFAEASWFIKIDYFPFFNRDDYTWDGILGLAYNNLSSPLNLTNPIQSMKKRGLLDRNIFSLKLPRGRDAGELLFGDVNKDLFIGSLKKLPVIVAPSKAEFFTGQWVIPATSVGAGNGSAEFGEGSEATLDSDYPMIGFPADIAFLLNDYLGFKWERGSKTPPAVNCQKRGEMENITITLGEHDFILTPWDYTVEIDADGLTLCVTVIWPMPDRVTGIIALGSAFLRKFYTVFDLDDMTVGFAELAPVKAATSNDFSLKVDLKR